MTKVLDLKPLLKKKKDDEEAAEAKKRAVRQEHERIKERYGKPRPSGTRAEPEQSPNPSPSEMRAEPEQAKPHPSGDCNAVSTAQLNRRTDKPPPTTTVVIESTNLQTPTPTKPKG